MVVFTELDLGSSVFIPPSTKRYTACVTGGSMLAFILKALSVCCLLLPVLRTLQQLHPNLHWQWLLALDYGGALVRDHVFTVIFPLINLPLSLPRSLRLHVCFASTPDQEASSCLPARLAAAGNAAVRLAFTAQKGEERESREGEERQRAGAQEEQSQEDEVNELTRGGGITKSQTLQYEMQKKKTIRKFLWEVSEPKVTLAKYIFCPKPKDYSKETEAMNGFPKFGIYMKSLVLLLPILCYCVIAKNKKNRQFLLISRYPWDLVYKNI